MTQRRNISLRGSRRFGLAAVLGVLALTAAACSSAAAGGGSGARAGTVRVGHSALGTVLVNSAGRTLYAFSADSPSAIVCGASCTPIWPPLTVPSSTTPTAGSGVTGQLGTVTRADGSHQVTYNGLLLYTYTGDSGSGQTKGQGIVEQYGATKGTWTVVTPSSKAASVAPTTTAPPPASTTTAPKPAAPTAPGAATTAPAPTTTAPAPTTTAPAPTTTVPPTTTTTAGGTWA